MGGKPCKVKVSVSAVVPLDLHICFFVIPNANKKKADFEEFL